MVATGRQENRKQFKILTVVGARPQFIKAAMVSRALAGYADIQEVLVHTGQHYDYTMSDRFFTELALPEPARNLEIGSGSHGRQTGRMLERLDEVMAAERPDRVLVYGDTNSTLAAALAAAKLRIPLAHVEAGLRSFNRAMPEEINRLLTDRVSDLLFAPTPTAVENLAREGISGEPVHLVGDVMYDAALAFRPLADAKDFFRRVGVEAGSYVLATIHRAENTDDPIRLRAILDGLRQASRLLPVVLPLHPRTRVAVDSLGLGGALEGLLAVPPLGYLEMLAALDGAAAVVTDSGGVQKEAFFVGTPCLIVRRETEWVELVERGFARLVEPEEIGSGVRCAGPRRSAEGENLYGGGRAAERVAATVAAAGARR